MTNSRDIDRDDNVLFSGIRLPLGPIPRSKSPLGHQFPTVFSNTIQLSLLYDSTTIANEFVTGLSWDRVGGISAIIMTNESFPSLEKFCWNV